MTTYTPVAFTLKIMNGALVFIGILFVVVIGMNAVATRRVYKSDFYEPAQKRAQYGVIWLVPVLGAILCYGLAEESVGPHSERYSDHKSLYDDGSVGFEIADNDHFGGGHHSD